MARQPMIGPHDKRSRLTITLPVDANGDPATDENGKPLKSVEAVSFRLPRFDMMPRHVFKEMQSAMNAVTDMVDDGGKPLSEADRSYELILAALRPFVSDEIHKLLCDQPTGVLEQISSDWNEASSIPLGELRGSTNSSPSTKKPSNTSSSTVDSESVTSESD